VRIQREKTLAAKAGLAIAVFPPGACASRLHNRVRLRDGGSWLQARIVAGDALQSRWRSSSATNEEMRVLGGTSGV